MSGMSRHLTCAVCGRVLLEDDDVYYESNLLDPSRPFFVHVGESTYVGKKKYDDPGQPWPEPKD